VLLTYCYNVHIITFAPAQYGGDRHQENLRGSGGIPSIPRGNLEVPCTYSTLQTLVAGVYIAPPDRHIGKILVQIVPFFNLRSYNIVLLQLN
jgi:hypothetical protein